jgi:hypothetical protein
MSWILEMPEVNYLDKFFIPFLKLHTILIVVIIWDVVPCSQYMNQRFGGTYYLHLQGSKPAEQETSVLAGDTSLLNVASYTDYTALLPRR